MSVETIDINEAQDHLKELIHRVVLGQHVILSEKKKPVAQLLPVSGRVAGLHAGTIWTSDNFDASLPEKFWMGEK